DLATPLDQPLRLVGGLDVLEDPAVGAVGVALAHVVDHPLERPPPRADPLDRGDLAGDREDRLDLQGCADPRLGAADPPAPAEVLERVDAEPDLQVLTGLVESR